MIQGVWRQEKTMQHRRRIVALAVGAIFAGAFAGQAAMAGTPEAQKWIDSEFQPSTLSKQQQADEMKWFIDTAAKLKTVRNWSDDGIIFAASCKEVPSAPLS